MIIGEITISTDGLNAISDTLLAFTNYFLINFLVIILKYYKINSEHHLMPLGQCLTQTAFWVPLWDPRDPNFLGNIRS